MLIASLTVIGPAFAKAKPTPVPIAYLTQEQEAPPPLSNPDPFIKDKGLPGAELAIEDNNTTGQFTGQQFVLKAFIAPLKADPLATFKENISGKYRFVVVNLPADQLKKLAALQEAKETLLLDIATQDDQLRNQDCRANVLHLLPSRAMRADALAQYLLKKRWTKLFLLQGNHDEDRMYGEAVKRAARRFGLEIVSEKNWEHTADARRTEQSDVPVLTQADEYDVLVVADERGEFGEYLDYRTWLPRPVAGTQGLTATAWHRTHEQWGAVQLQNRFKDKYGRGMEEIDYAGYLAVRAVGEAATRAQSNELKPIRDYMLSPALALQGYKGTPLSFRAWDGQLRQTVLLAAPRSLVAVAPVEGFLHPKTELDTLGYDQPESTCQLNK
ncbi:ABC transporter substrate-binding protein [Methylomicrobium sp. Wu6]|uniref:ABC transporter substrate-binding protein n=1 Tax=Methylomicrobium sp. Wu6 TaxID=3107928 RepID=UPI002DD66F32|nr:ABC transporter substrate-binding protein [Methylomicrobium sp. Wu6]MEC4747824.1 ABC transporter substrate-binding protein [Methylomicrobium sp. Wu6]